MRIKRFRVLSTSRLGQRGAILLTLGSIDLLYGGSQIAPSQDVLLRPDTVWRDHYATSGTWGALWCLIGAVCVVTSFMRQDRAGYGLQTGLLTLWSLTSIAGQIWGGYSRGYVSAGIWGAFLVLTVITSGIQEPIRSEEVVAIEEGPEDGA